MTTTNQLGAMMLTDEQILEEFERRAFSPLRTADGLPTLDAVRLIEGVRALLSASKPAVPQTIMRFNIHGTLINPEPNGMYVRYEDHARALAASPAAPAQSAEPVAGASNAKAAQSITRMIEAWMDDNARGGTDWRAGSGLANVIELRLNRFYTAPQSTQPAKAGEDDVRERIARALHYPACWDTAAYPTLESAAWEAIACAKLGCSTCEAPESAVVLDDERAAFQAWALAEDFSVIRNSPSMDAGYTDPVTAHLWEGWQARAASPQAARVPDDERAAKFKEALHDHFNEFPIPTQLGVVAIMKHIEKVYAELDRAASPQATKCRACNGNDGDMPCAYPEGHANCLRNEATATQTAQTRALTDEQRIPAGWRFYTADFSLSPGGSVMLTRDAAGKDWWHKLPEEQRDSANLFVSGRGATLAEAIDAAIANLTASGGDHE